MQVETKRCEIINKVACDNVNCKTRLDECIDKIAKNEGYTTYSVLKKNITTDGGNYLGMLSEIDIKGETINGYKETAIFCKTMTPDAIDMVFMSLQSIYKVELFAYMEFSKIINELQDKANIPVEERFNMVKCFDESYEMAILMDNLTRKGYKTWFRMDVVSLDMAEVCIKQLARFHGTSFALKELSPNFFNNNIKPIKTPFLFYTNEWKDFDAKFYKIGLDNLDDDVRRRVAVNLRKILDKYPKYLSDTKSQYVMCHGDYRPNNILVKEKDGIITDAVTVDFQLIHYGCPVIDFFYFIYMSTDSNFRKAHMNYLKNLYYDSLGAYLLNFDISVESVFPRKLFESLYEEKRDFGIMTGIFYSPFLFVAEGGEVPDVTKESMKDIEFKFDDKFQLRLGEIIQEFIDIGVL